MSRRAAGHGYAPPETFRVRHHAKSPEFFIVHVGKSLRAMRATMKRCLGHVHPKQLGACVSATSDELPGLMGIVFVAQPLGAGLVSHELAHAAFRAMDAQRCKVQHWRFRDARGNMGHESEERYAEALEQLTKDFWNEAYRLGLVE